MMRIFYAVAIGLLCFFSCADEDPINLEKVLAGGSTSVFAEFSNAFQFPAANLSPIELQNHRRGDVAFESSFVTAPSQINAGLGPIFNQNSCVSCHGKNGRSPFPNSESDLLGLLFRVSIPGINIHGGPKPVPGFGGQLQTKAVFGKKSEVSVKMNFIEIPGSFSDGEAYSLRKPIFNFDNAYIPLPGDVMISPRIAPPVFGLGLLEAISVEDILKHADPIDLDKDGISGRPNYCWDELSQSLRLGRFGWKAGQPNLLQQTAAAYLDDIGVTSPLFFEESSKHQIQYDGGMDDPEINNELLSLTTFYTQSLAVPVARNQDDPEVLSGSKIFDKIACGKCHVRNFKTGTHTEFAFLSNQHILAFTDLLLHDMGDSLSDHRPEFEAQGNEWRTPPLWGIGLTKIVNGHSNFLHDGRARNFQEAILWHGGEANQSVLNYKNLSKKDRTALLKFLNSL